MIIGTLESAGSLKLDCLTNIGAQLQFWLSSFGTELWTTKGNHIQKFSLLLS